MNIKIIISQILALVAFIFFFKSLQCNNKKKVLYYQIIANIFFALQYFCLNLWSAFTMDILTIIRCIVFYNYTKSNKKVPNIIFVDFIILTISLGVITYSSIISIIPIIIALIYTYGLYEKKLSRFRISCLVAAIMWIIYNLLSGAYVATIGNLIELSGSIFAIYKYDLKKGKKHV